MATAKTIKFVTWNINGLKQKKCKELYGADVVFLQETHIGQNNNCRLDVGDEWNFYYTQYTSSRKGSAILVRKTLDFKSISVEKDINGSYLVLKCKLGEQLYTLVSVYNHHADVKTLDTLTLYLQHMATGMLVIGGDFNTVLNPFIDKKTQSKPGKVTNNRSHDKLRGCVEKFMKSLQLVDVWRRMNPATREYTFNKNNIKSRLDYFFIPEECMWRIETCEINNLQRPDHQPLSLQVNNVAVISYKKDVEIHYIGQLLHHKRGFGIVEADLSLNENNKCVMNEIDLVTAIQSLQVSDTPRPDGIPVSFYKEVIQDLIPYLKVLYSRMLSDSFDFQKTHFCESVQNPHGGEQRFFNVDYLIIATILARRLEDHLESQYKGHKPKGLAAFGIAFKSPCPQVKWCYIKKALEEQKRFTEAKNNSASCQDFVIMENLLRNAEDFDSDGNTSEFSSEKCKKLCQGCPLTPVLMTLILKSISSNLFGHSEQHKILVFKQSVIVCVPTEDQDKVKASLMNRLNDLQRTDTVVQPKENEVENWDVEFEEGEETLVNSEEEDDESYFEQEECEESDHEEDDESEVENDLQEKGSTFHYRQTMYAVVTLKPSAEVVVVAKTWLTEDKQQSHWPPFKSPESITQAVIDRCVPVTQGKLWEKVDVTVQGEFDTYDGAKKIQQLLRSQGVSKKKIPPSQQPGSSPLKRKKLFTEKKLQPGPSQSAVTSHIHPAAPSIQLGPKPNETDNIMKLLKEINSKVQKNSAMLGVLLKRVDQPGLSMLSKKFKPKLPLTSPEEVNRLEEELKDDTTMQNYVQHLRTLGGTGNRKIIRTIMQAVMTEDLAEAFSWKKGRQNKKAMSVLTLSRVIKEAALYRGIDHTDTEKEIMKWLRFVADRNNRKKLKDLKDLKDGNQTVTSVTAPDYICDSQASPLLYNLFDGV
uniref:DUF4806 domain-containing protein n=1 Tax=Astyanax mexicanus TaxID=7994 RepID=A0A8B9LY89_ASTMX